MAREENLTLKGKAINSTEKAQKLGKLGGLQKGINNKRKKAYKEQLLAVIELGQERAIKEAKKAGNTEAVKMLEEGGLIAFEKLNIALSKKIKAETRLKALDSIVDRLEGKAVQKSNIKVQGAIPPLQTNQDKLDKSKDDIIKNIDE